MKKLLVLIMLICVFFTTGCFKYNDMDNINIITTVYPIEYVTNRLYGSSSNISSVYPKSADIYNYTFTDKQIKDFSKKDMFIYNGESSEREYAKTMLDYNRNLKIINASYGIDSTYSEREIWLNPANILMIAQNIKDEIEKYITSNYIIADIEANYEDLKVDMTELETEFKITADNSTNKTLIVYDESLNFLNKYGFEVINLTNNGEKIEKNIELAKSLFNSNKLSYLFVMENTDDNDVINDMINNNAKKTIFRSLETITEKDVSNKNDYISIMKSNIDLLKQETYK